MRVSIWKQDAKGKRWRRICVVQLVAWSEWPFKRAIPHGDSISDGHRFPRYGYYPLEGVQFELFGERRG